MASRLIDQRRPIGHQQLFIDKKVMKDEVPMVVVDGLYRGSIGAVKNKQLLKECSASHVLCVAGGIDACFVKQLAFKVVTIDDAPTIKVFFRRREILFVCQ